MKKISFKKFPIWLVSIAIFLLPFTAWAGDPPEDMPIRVALLIGWIFQILYIFPLGILLGVFLKLMIALTTFNIFVNSNAVILGWVMVRDVANLFFVVILLVIAFATILQFESYNYKRLLPKLFLMALLINFSKMFAGMIIDLSNVVMNFFAAPFQDAGYAFFLKGLQLDQLLALNTIGTSDAVKNNTQLIPIVAGLIIATIVLSVTFFVVLAFVLILVIRIVAFWILIVLSPLAFLCGVIPATQKYWSQWWQELSKYAIVGPVMAFFLWLGFSLMSGDNDVVENLNKLEGLGTFANIGSTASSSLTFLSKYVVIIAFLLVGLKVSQQLGIAGSGLIGSVLGSVKKNMMRYGKLAAIASGVGGVAFTPGVFTAATGAAGKWWGATAIPKVAAISPALGSAMGWAGGAAGMAAGVAGYAGAAGGAIAGAFPTVTGLVGGGWLAKRWGKKKGGIIGGAVGKAGSIAPWLVGAPLVAGGIALAAKGIKSSGKEWIDDRSLETRSGFWRGVASRTGSRMARKRRDILAKKQSDIKDDARSALFRSMKNPADIVSDFKSRSKSKYAADQEWTKVAKQYAGAYLGHSASEIAQNLPTTEEDLAKMPAPAKLLHWMKLEEARTSGPSQINTQSDRLLAQLIKTNVLDRAGGAQFGFDKQMGFTDSDNKIVNPFNPKGPKMSGPVLSRDKILQTIENNLIANPDDTKNTFGLTVTPGVAGAPPTIGPSFHRGGTAGGALEPDPRTASFIDLAREKSVGLNYLSPDELRAHILKNTTDDELGRKGLERQEFETRMRQATPSQLRGQVKGEPKQAIDTQTGQVTQVKPRGRIAKKIFGERKPKKGSEFLPRQGIVTGKWGSDGATSLGEDTHGMMLSFEELARFLPEDQAKMLSEQKGEEAMNIPEPLKQAYAQAIAKYISLQRAGLEQTKDPKDLAKALEAMGLGVDRGQVEKEIGEENGIDVSKLRGEEYGDFREEYGEQIKDRINKKIEKRKETGLQKLDVASERLTDSRFVSANPMNLVNADVTSDINRREQLRHEGGHTTVEAMVKNGADLEEEFGRLDPKTQEILTERITQKGMGGLTRDKQLEEMFADFHGGASKELRANERELDKTWKFGGAEKLKYDQTVDEEEKKNSEYGQFVHRDKHHEDIKEARTYLRTARKDAETRRDQETDPTKRKTIDRDLEDLDKEDEKLNERERKLKSNRFTKHDEAVGERDKAREEMHDIERNKGRDSAEYKSARERYEKANDTVEGLSARPGSREEMLRRNRVKEGVAPTPAPQTNLSPEELREVLSGGLPQLGAAATGALVANVVTNMKQEFKLPEVQNRINQQFANRATNNLIGSANDFANPNSPFYVMRMLKSLREGIAKLTESAQYEQMYDKKERGRIEDTLRNIGSLQKTAKKLETRYSLSTETPDVEGAASDFQVQTLMDAVNDFFKGGGKT